MTVSQTLVILGVCAAAAVIQGSLGIGMGLVASVPLLWIDPAFAPGPLLFGGQFVGGRLIIVEWEHLPRRDLKRAAIGVPPGAVLGLLTLTMISQRTLSLLIGASLIASAVLLLAGFKLPDRPGTAFGAGLVSAFCSATAAIPGPALVMGFCDLKPAQFRALASAFIGLLSVVLLVGFSLTGNFGMHELGLLLRMLPGLVLGIVLSRWTRPMLDGKDFFRPLILALALVAGILLILRQL